VADFSKLIKEKDKGAQYMIDEITHICKNIPKRTPGEEGEKIACEYMADVLKKDGGCETAKVEPFSLHPQSFYGWVYITVSTALLGIILFYFMPILAAVVMALGFFVMFMEFGIYKQFIDFMFPKRTGHNVTAIKKCTGEVKARIFFNGHPDAAWVWPVNNKFGGAAYESHIVLSVGGDFLFFILSIIGTVFLAKKTGKFWFTDFSVPVYTAIYGKALFWFSIAALVFVPFIFGMYFLWNPKVTVDGANDNLTGCYMGIAILKAMKDAGIELEHTEVGVILSGCEEAGLRGAKAWVKQHKDEYKDVPTWIFAYDTIAEAKFLAVNYKNMNGMIDSDKEAAECFMESAKELGIQCNKSMVPPFGGGVDSAAFAKGGYKSVGITALNHVLQDYYHTMKDTYTNLSKETLENCYATSVKVLEKFDQKYGQGK